jgi:predicted alpha/beta-hydrolase family hydrolase
MEAPPLIFDGPETAHFLIVLAHGAGAPMDSPFMNQIAGLLADKGLRTARFEFPYMRERRDTGGKRPPDRQPVLLETWQAVISSLGPPARQIIGGKSMGGRMASMIADEAGVAGLVCLGYPFHAPGRADKPRTEHLATLKTPALILQGERDPFGRPDEVAGYDLSDRITTHWLPDGDHDLKPRKKSGITHDENMTAAASLIADFAKALA